MIGKIIDRTSSISFMGLGFEKSLSVIVLFAKSMSVYQSLKVIIFFNIDCISINLINYNNHNLIISDRYIYD